MLLDVVPLITGKPMNGVVPVTSQDKCKSCNWVGRTGGCKKLWKEDLVYNDVNHRQENKEKSLND